MPSVCSWKLPLSPHLNQKTNTLTPINKSRGFLKINTLLWLRNESTAGRFGFFPSRHMFPVFIVLLLKSKDCCSGKDKSHQAEQETMNQTSSFPAYDEVLNESVQHMVDKFYWTLPGWKGWLYSACNPCFFWDGEGPAWWDCRVKFVALIHTFFNLHNCLTGGSFFVLQHTN